MQAYIAAFLAGVGVGFGLGKALDVYEGFRAKRVWKARCPHCQRVLESTQVGWYECGCGFRGGPRDVLGHGSNGVGYLP